MKREKEELDVIFGYLKSLENAIKNKNENFDYEYFFKIIYFNDEEYEKFKKFALPFVDDAVASVLEIIKNGGEEIL